MKRVCKAFVLLIVSSLLLTLLYNVISEVEHVGPRRVKIKSRFDDLHMRDQLGTEQLQYQPHTTPLKKSLREPLETRKDLLLKECQRLQENGSEFHNIEKSRLNHIIVNDKHKVLYCYLPKVACTNLKRIFLVLTGKMNVTDPLKLRAVDVHSKLDDYLTYLNTLPPKGIKYRIKNYKKVIFVREPLERILSAYRNKFLQRGNEYFKQRYGIKVIKNYRENPSKKSLEKGDDMKFSEFVDYLVDKRTLIQGFNEHWDTYYNLCSPCHLRYNFIGKYETLEEDVDLLLKDIGADETIELPKRGETYKARKTEDILEKFYKDVKPDNIFKLLDVFKLDYSIFGYQLPETLRKYVQI